MKTHGSGISVNINAHDGHGHSCPPGHDVLRVLDIPTRDAIPPHHRHEGLWVLVLEEMKFYRLTGGLTNDCWVACGDGHGGDISPDDLPIASKTEKGIVQIGDNINVDTDGLIAVANATENTAGVIELASVDEAKAGIDATKAVTPAGLAEALVTDKVDNPLPVASKTQRGIVQIGDNINVDTDGLIAVANATEDTAGVVELASVEESKAGTDATKAVTPASLSEALVQDKVDHPLPIASKVEKGIVQIGNGLTVLDGVLSVPEIGIATDLVTGLVKGGANINIAEDGTISVPDLVDMMMRGIGVKNLSGLSPETIPPNDFDQLWDTNRMNSIQSGGQLNGPDLGSGVAFCFGTSTGTRVQLFCTYNGDIALRSQSGGTVTSWEKFVRKSEFISQKSSSGYAMLPDGVMLQWTSGSIPIEGGSVVFPTTFPNGCAKVFCTIKSSGSHEASATYSDNTKSGVYIRHNAGVVAGVSIFAIGY